MASVLCLLVVFNVVVIFSYAVEPRYVDIGFAECHINISNSVAECKVKVIGQSVSNTYRVTMVLYQDDNDYATWTYEGISLINETETCYVTRDHEYYVGIYIAVYDPNGNFIEDAIAYTGTYYY